MECISCGNQIPDGYKFCPECGAPAPQNKVCPNCKTEVPLKMKFCFNCGFNFEQDSNKNTSGFAMGDKNVIAGDVIGSSEDFHISGNATIVKNTDETKKVVTCHLCGKNLTIVNSYTCPKCKEVVCEECFNKEKKACLKCSPIEITPTLQNEITVSKDGNSKYTTITSALKDIATNGIINVKSGTYEEDFVVNKSVTIIGDSTNKPIFTSNNNYIVDIQQDASFKNIIFQNLSSLPDTPSGYALVQLSSNKGTFTYCEFRNGNKHGISLKNHSILNMSYCKVHKCVSNGLFISDNASGQIDNTEICNNQNQGVCIEQNATPTFNSCTVYNNEKSGFFLLNSPNATITNTQISNNVLNGVFFKDNSKATIDSCDIHDNTFNIQNNDTSSSTITRTKIYNDANSNILVRDNANCSVRECDIYSAEEDGIYALGQSVCEATNCQIHDNKKNGVEFNETTNSTVSKSNIYNNTSYGVYIHGQTKSTIKDCEIYSCTKANISVGETANPTIENCHSYNSKAGGLFIWGQATGTYTNLNIHDTELSGIEVSDTANPTIKNSKSNNTNGNGIKVRLQATGTYINCECVNNKYANIWQENTSNPNFQNTVNTPKPTTTTTTTTTASKPAGKISQFGEERIPGGICQHYYEKSEGKILKVDVENNSFVHSGKLVMTSKFTKDPNGQQKFFAWENGIITLNVKGGDIVGQNDVLFTIKRKKS